MTELIKTEEFFNNLTKQTLTRYMSSKGKISLAPPSEFTLGEYEIFAIDGADTLFAGVERYPTLAEAEARIYELLGD